MKKAGIIKRVGPDNGDTPTEPSVLYEPGTPVAMNSSMTIKALAVYSGWYNSATKDLKQEKSDSPKIQKTPACARVSDKPTTGVEPATCGLRKRRHAF